MKDFLNYQPLFLMNEAGEGDAGGAELEQESVETEEVVAEPTVAEKKLLKALKIKFNGKEMEEELPFEIPEEHAEYMRRQLQMAKMGQSKAQQLSAIESELHEFFQQLHSNPRAILKQYGLDEKTLAAQILEEEIENSKKSPEQLKIEEYERKLREVEAQRQKEKEDLDRRDYEASLERAYQHYENMIDSALDTSNLPSTPYVVDKMAKYMSIAIDNNQEPDMNIIANIVRQEMVDDVKHLASVLPVETLEELLGQEILTKLRKNRLAQAKKAPVPTSKIATDVAKPKEKQEVKPVQTKTIRDIFGI